MATSLRLLVSRCKMEHHQQQIAVLQCRLPPAVTPQRATLRADFTLRAAAAAEEVEGGIDDPNDLWQFPDRHKWYLPRYSADDAPDWQPARFVRAVQLTPQVREVVLEVEISRERIPLRNAYRRIGQTASVRVNNSEEFSLPVCCPPFSRELNKKALYLTRGDLPVGETKRTSEPISVTTTVSLYVTEEECKELYHMAADDAVEVGPFVGGGLALRPMLSMYRFPTVVIFAEGAGIAAAKALIEAEDAVGGIMPKSRESVTLYYRAPNSASIAFEELFDTWQQKYGVRTITSTRDSFQEMFDYDDDLVYEPTETAAVVVTGGDEESEEEALKACKEAEIGTVIRQSQPAAPTQFVESGGEREF